jgi:hypothetical protein
LKEKQKEKPPSRTASVDYHSPQELEPIIKDEKSEEKEDSPQGPVP